MSRLRSLRRGAYAALMMTALVSTSFADDAFAQGRKPPGAADPVKVATAHFKAGTALYQKRNFAAALEQFRLSYETVASPNSGLYIARCHVELRQPKEAYLQFQKVIAEAEARIPTEPKYKPTLDTARQEIDAVAKNVARVTVQVSNATPSSTLRVGPNTIPREQWGQTLVLDPGPVDIVLDTVGSPPVSQRHDLRPGDQKTFQIGMQAAVTPPPQPPRRTDDDTELELLPLSLAFAGVGVVGMGMFGVAGGMSLSTYSEVEDSCPGPACTDELIDRGEREQLIANVGVVIGAVGLAAGATIFIVDVANGSSSDREASVPVNVAFGPGYVGVNGRF